MGNSIKKTVVKGLQVQLFDCPEIDYPQYFYVKKKGNDFFRKHSLVQSNGYAVLCKFQANG